MGGASGPVTVRDLEQLCPVAAVGDRKGEEWRLCVGVRSEEKERRGFINNLCGPQTPDKTVQAPRSEIRVKEAQPYGRHLILQGVIRGGFAGRKQK
ncbi:hypothetical protein chiPu_0017228 [Chiloscyllium punctatum]|uniref:Uncharacterized protein n=1 Tax=Chiloscyllium punctatum TaxID=137246 RepID=A0A401T7W3_CHIPU|nr:hypothetical protein [Chiloscyllium punctatum]